MQMRRSVMSGLLPLALALPPGAPLSLALWTILTAMRAADYARRYQPYLNPVSMERQAGLVEVRIELYRFVLHLLPSIAVNCRTSHPQTISVLAAHPTGGPVPDYQGPREAARWNH
jgi:hypothetical protein